MNDLPKGALCSFYIKEEIIYSLLSHASRILWDTQACFLNSHISHYPPAGFLPKGLRKAHFLTVLDNFLLPYVTKVQFWHYFTKLLFWLIWQFKYSLPYNAHFKKNSASSYGWQKNNFYIPWLTNYVCSE